MGINEKDMLGEEVLQGVTGGAGGAAFDAKRKEFDDAWIALGMEEKGYSGMTRPELFDSWQLRGGDISAYTFLASLPKK
jgi:hypothetical protein